MLRQFLFCLVIFNTIWEDFLPFSVLLLLDEQFYLKTGTCKFGASCKFHHPKHSGGSMSHVPLNIYGYPLRPVWILLLIFLVELMFQVCFGILTYLSYNAHLCLLYQGEKECSYYLKTGQCKFGITCKFHHPQPAGTSLPASAPQFYPPVQSPTVPMAEQYGGASTSLRVARPPLLASSYVQGAYGPVLFSPGVVPFSGWNPYSVWYDCFCTEIFPKRYAFLMLSFAYLV